MPQNSSFLSTRLLFGKNHNGSTSNISSTTQSILVWNTQLDLWNQIIMMQHFNNTTPIITTTTTTSEESTVLPTMTTSLSERSISKNHHNTTKSIILWQSNRNNIPIYISDADNNNHIAPCEMVLWTTGMMILTMLLPKRTLEGDDNTQQQHSSNHHHFTENENDITTTTIQSQPEPPWYNIHTVIPWMNCEYIDIFQNNNSNNNNNNTTFMMTSKSTNDVSCHHETTNVNHTTEEMVHTTAVGTVKQYSYGIRCHFNNHHHNSHTNDNHNNTTTTSTKCTISMVFVAQSQRDMVYQLMTNVMIQYHTYHPGTGIMSHIQNHGTPPLEGEEEDQLPPPPPQQPVLGWQYHYYYEPYFTMAVTNIMEDHDQHHQPSTMTKYNINRIDTYNGMTPLHYAVYYNHVPAIVQLIEMSSSRSSNSYNNLIDMNIVDENHSWTPLDYCIMYQLPVSTMDLLKQYGATKITVATFVKSNQKSHYEIKGELFGKVTATEQIIDERRCHQRRELEQQKMILEQMEQNNNLLLQMQQRGEQIDTLSQGATQLQQNANEYASMAKQLKERTKRQHDKYNTWFPFGG